MGFETNDPLGKYSLTPMPSKMVDANNYIDFTSASGSFAQQYLPELYEAEVERYGNRTISGFLRMVGAEMPMSSDQVIWSEQNRLHLVYTGATVATGDATISGLTDHAIRVGQTLIVTDGAGTVDKVIVTEVATNSVECAIYGGDNWSAAIIAATDLTVIVYGSEFAKGTGKMDGSIEPGFTQFNVSPIIMKDHYRINGSDTAQIGWVEVATEDGTSGYLWYLKAESETRLRFEDYCETAMVEAEKAIGSTTGANLSAANATNFNAASSMAGNAARGTEGLFAAIEDRGNVYGGFAAGSAGAGAVADFDKILKNLDKQGSIEENMLFLNREMALEMDDMLAQVNGGFGGATGPQGASFGLFNNEAEMALNLGFSGFRRGSYDFYKTDWKYLNDFSTRGNIGDIDGVLIPAGTSTVYDQLLGSNIRRPFLHVRYRASQADDRRMKSWLTGSVGGAFSSTLDAMEVNFLSERCLCVQARNNFVLFTA